MKISKFTTKKTARKIIKTIRQRKLISCMILLVLLLATTSIVLIQRNKNDSDGDGSKIFGTDALENTENLEPGTSNGNTKDTASTTDNENTTDTSSTNSTSSSNNDAGSSNESTGSENASPNNDNNGSGVAIIKLPSGGIVSSFAGSWYHNFGTMNLTQNGTKVTGTFTNNPNGTNGTINGTVSGSVLTGTWQSGASQGTISFTRSGKTFTGNYGGSNGTHKWCGALSGNAFPSKCGFTNSWYITAGAATNCTGSMTQTNIHVAGLFNCGKGDISLAGDISYPGGYTEFIGTWTGGQTDVLHMYLADLDGYPEQPFFQGAYQYSGVNHFDFCGGYASSDKPATCLKF